MITDKILIIGAMKDVELNIILDAMIINNEYKEVTCTFYEGKLYGREIIVCHSNVGIINASVATTIGIKKYNPTAIFTIGTAGAHKEEIHSGDLVIATSIVDLNSINFETKVIDTNKVLLELMKNFKCEDYKVHFGIIGSGDVWTKELDKIKEFANKYSTTCEEMESAAVYTVSRAYEIPTIAIRVISNNELLGEEYQRELGENSQKYLLKFLRENFK